MKPLFFLVLLLAETGYSQLPIFPGAEGYGKFVTGGRSGKVLRVTSLNESGPGTLRTMLEDSSFTRIIVFPTSGVCTLTSNIVVGIEDSNFTLVPWTAPGDGFIIRGAAISINARNWAIIGATILVGDSAAGPQPDNRDAIQVNQDCDHWMVAFSDFGWWIDSNQIFGGADSGSFIYNFSIEPLDSSLHPKGLHADHLNITGSNTNIFLGWNLFAHGKARMFQVAMDYDNISAVNNVIYNFSSVGTELQPDTTAPRRMDLMGNLYIYGPDSPANLKEISVSGGVAHPNNFPKFYLQRNIGTSGTDWQLVQNNTTPNDTTSYKSLFEVVPSVPRGYREYPTASNEIRDFVLDNSGSRIPAMRAIDSTIISNVKTQAGEVKDCVGPAKASMPKTIYWPDSTVERFARGTKDSIYVMAMPGCVTPGRYDNFTIQVDRTDGSGWDESRTIDTSFLRVVGTCLDQNQDTLVMTTTTAWQDSLPKRHSGYRIHNVFNDSTRATLPFPTIAQVTWPDADSDGMPDWLEKRLSGSESDSTSMITYKDQDGDGYTNIEEWWIDMIPLIQSTIVKR